MQLPPAEERYEPHLNISLSNKNIILKLQLIEENELCKMQMSAQIALLCGVSDWNKNNIPFPVIYSLFTVLKNILHYQYPDCRDDYLQM